MGLDINLQTSKIDISEEDGINVDLYTDKLDIEESEAEDIIIEITGLKSINKFICLEDTPLYYENGKFFKVQDNKIIYTDIEWKDITGDIDEGSILFKIIDSSIKAHNENPTSHPYLHNIIQDNYNTLDDKIDNIEEEIRQSITSVEGSALINVSRNEQSVTISSKTYIFEQGIASNIWEIEHNLNKYPSVTTVDSAGTIFEATVDYIDKNNCIVYINGSTKGIAYLN